MSLLDRVESACVTAVKKLVADLSAGTRQDQAVLLNLREEDRVPESAMSAFHLELTIASGPSATNWLCSAAKVAQFLLPVPTPLPRAIRKSWWTYVTLETLQHYGYVK